MPETSQIPQSVTVEPEVEVEAPETSAEVTSPETASGPTASTVRKIRYCPKCHARYLKEATDCVSCGVALVDEQPRDAPFFRPAIDLPYVAALALFVFGHDRLGGEAQSFGFIFLLVGFATLVTFRAIGYAEWLGRR